jgi:Cys/Met metabolism PLP-dependent enzyme
MADALLIMVNFIIFIFIYPPFPFVLCLCFPSLISPLLLSSPSRFYAILLSTPSRILSFTSPSLIYPLHPLFLLYFSYLLPSYLPSFPSLISALLSSQSLGAVESLAESPAVMTHASVPPEIRAELGMSKRQIHTDTHAHTQSQIQTHTHTNRSIQISAHTVTQIADLIILQILEH